MLFLWALPVGHSHLKLSGLPSPTATTVATTLSPSPPPRLCVTTSPPYASTPPAITHSPAPSRSPTVSPCSMVLLLAQTILGKAPTSSFFIYRRSIITWMKEKKDKITHCLSMNLHRSIPIANHPSFPVRIDPELAIFTYQPHIWLLFVDIVLRAIYLPFLRLDTLSPIIHDCASNTSSPYL